MTGSTLRSCYCRHWFSSAQLAVVISCDSILETRPSLARMQRAQVSNLVNFCQSVQSVQDGAALTSGRPRLVNIWAPHPRYPSCNLTWSISGPNSPCRIPTVQHVQFTPRESASLSLHTQSRSITRRPTGSRSFLLDQRHSTRGLGRRLLGMPNTPGIFL